MVAKMKAQKAIAWLGAGALTALLTHITFFEGRELTVYRDAVGILTACDGETGYVVRPGDIKPGATFTVAQCEAALTRSVDRIVAEIAPCLSRNPSEGQKIAFTGMAYNVGSRAFCTSSVAKNFNAGNDAAACAAIDLWVKARVNGQLVPLRGLVKRRAAERGFCEGAK
jgi:lysozyme